MQTTGSSYDDTLLEKVSGYIKRDISDVVTRSSKTIKLQASKTRKNPEPGNRVILWTRDNEGKFYSASNFYIKHTVFLFGDHFTDKYSEHDRQCKDGTAEIARKYDFRTRRRDYSSLAYGITIKFPEDESLEWPQYEKLLNSEFDPIFDFVGAGGYLVIPVDSDGKPDLWGDEKDKGSNDLSRYLKTKIEKLFQMGQDNEYLPTNQSLFYINDDVAKDNRTERDKNNQYFITLTDEERNKIGKKIRDDLQKQREAVKGIGSNLKQYVEGLPIIEHSIEKQQKAAPASEIHNPKKATSKTSVTIHKADIRKDRCHCTIKKWFGFTIPIFGIIASTCILAYAAYKFHHIDKSFIIPTIIFLVLLIAICSFTLCYVAYDSCSTKLDDIELRNQYETPEFVY